MNIYVASSWRNNYQPEVIEALRASGHSVYDFRNPDASNHDFHWSEIDPHWLAWNPEIFRTALLHPIAQSGFALDHAALKNCDCCVLVLPCGRSAHLEAGYCAGLGKPLLIYIPEPCEPELMYLEATKIVIDMPELVIAAIETAGALNQHS